MEDSDDLQSAIPLRSAHKYKRAYEAFLKWTKERNHEGAVTEAILIDYFKYLVWEKKGSPGTLQTLFSMIRIMHYQSQGVDLRDFSGIMPFIRNEMKDFKPKQAAVLTYEQVFQFLFTASDRDYLLQKVVLIMSVFGSINISELHALMTKDVRFDEINQEVLVVVRHPGTNKTRLARIENADRDIRPVFFIRKYNELAKRLTEPRTAFFMRYARGKVRGMRAGINYIAKTCKMVAKFLGLKNVNSYTSRTGIETAKMFKQLKLAVSLAPSTTIVRSEAYSLVDPTVKPKMSPTIQPTDPPTVKRIIQPAVKTEVLPNDEPIDQATVKLVAHPTVLTTSLDDRSAAIAQIFSTIRANEAVPVRKGSESSVETTTAQNKLLMQIVAQNQQMLNKVEQTIAQNEEIIAQNSRIIEMMVDWKELKELPIADDDDPFGGGDSRSSMEHSEDEEISTDELGMGLQEGTDFACYADDETPEVEEPIVVKMELENDGIPDEEREVLVKEEVDDY